MTGWRAFWSYLMFIQVANGPSTTVNITTIFAEREIRLFWCSINASDLVLMNQNEP